MTTWNRTGTVSVTTGSPTVTGAGVSWSNVQPGDAFHGPDGEIYEVSSVTGSTITLVENYGGSTASGASYAIQPTRGVLVHLRQQLADLIAQTPLRAANNLSDLTDAVTARTNLGVPLNNLPITGGTIDGVAIGGTTPAIVANVDNLRLDGNTISSTDTNGNIVLAPNGTGEVDISKVDIDGGTIDGVAIGGTTPAIVANVDNLRLDGNTISSTDTNGNINLAPNGTGSVTAPTPAPGDSSTKVATTAFVAGEMSRRAGAPVFDRVADIESATIASDVDFIAIAGQGAVADFLASTPSPVKPWHVQSDNGRYFELRFPDGMVNVRAFGAVGDDVADDTQAFKDAFEYINRAWWETSGGAAQGKFQRGAVFVPPGIFRINPDTTGDANVVPYDYLKLVGAGDGQSMIKAHTTGAGALIRRPETATFNSSQRTTHTLFRGLRFILTGENQTALDLAHCGRMRITENEFTRQDRVDEWNNANQSALTDTRAIRLRNSSTVLVGGDIVTIDHNHLYWMDRGIESGSSTTAPGPEALRVMCNEISDCLNPIVINDYGGAGGLLADNVIQRWAVGSRAIDIVGRMWTIRERYLESLDNDRPPILLRSGSRNIVVYRKSPVNYTAHAKTGSPISASLGTNDSGAASGYECIDEYGTTLATTFYGNPE